MVAQWGVVLSVTESLWSGQGEIGRVAGTKLEDAYFRAILEAMALRRGYRLTFDRDELAR